VYYARQSYIVLLKWLSNWINISPYNKLFQIERENNGFTYDMCSDSQFSKIGVLKEQAPAIKV